MRSPTHTNTRRRLWPWLQGQAALLLPGALVALALVLPSYRYRFLWGYEPADLYIELRGVFLFGSDLLLLLAVALWAVTPFVRRVNRLPRGLLAVWLALAFLATASALWAPLPVYTLTQAARLWLLLALALAIATTPEARGGLTWGLLLSGAAQAAVGLAQFVLQRSLDWRDLGEIVIRPEWAGAAIIDAGGERILRAYGLTQHPNLLGGFLMVCVLLGIGQTLGARSWRRALAAALTGAAFGGLLLTFSRSAWLGLIAGAGLALLVLRLRPAAWRRVDWRTAGRLAALLALIGALFALTQWRLLMPRLGITAAGQEIRSTDERATLTAGAAVLIRERPWLGVGYGNFAVALWQRQPPEMTAYPIYQPVHRVPLLAAAELGLPGLLLWLTLTLAPWAVLWHRRAIWPANGVPPALAAAAAGALAALTLVSLFDYYPWFSQQGHLLSWIIWGLVGQSVVRSACPPVLHRSSFVGRPSVVRPSSFVLRHSSNGATSMTDVLLVNPLFLNQDPVERRLVTPYFPLGLLYLAAVAREAGYEVAVFDAMFETSDDAFRAALERHRPRLVGIAALATVRAAALRLAGIARAAGVPVVMGGADPTGRPDAYLGSAGGAPAVDVAVIGEGEHTFVALLERLRAAGWPADLAGVDLADLPGLALPDGQGGIQRTPECTHITDLDSLPFPARDLVDVARYQAEWRRAHGFSSLSVIAGRGCPYGCTWCQKSVFGRTYRMRSPESVAEEMRQIKERYAPDQIRIVDDVLGVDRRWLRRFHDAVLERGAVIPFEALSRADLVDDDLIRQLSEIGCRRLAFGAESGSQRILDAMHKGTKIEQLYRTADLCRKHGIETYFYIMLGYPGEEWADIAATVRLLRETRPAEFSATVAYPLPGTEFYEQVKDRLVPSADWAHSAENRLLFRRRYSTRFYSWAQRLLRKEWQAARLAHGELRATPVQRARLAAGRLAAQAAVLALRQLPGEAEALPDGPPNLTGGA